MMLSPAPPPSTSFTPQLRSDYFFNEDPAVAQSPLQLPQLAVPVPVAADARYYYTTPTIDDDEVPGGRHFTLEPAALSSHAATATATATTVPTQRPTNRVSSQPPATSVHPHNDSHTPSPILQPKAVKGSPPAPSQQQPAMPPTHPVVSAASGASTLSIPAPLPFRPLSGHDGHVEYVGPFILGPVLGRGCTGTVRLGTHKHTGFEVAFKIIDKKYLNSEPKLWKKVKREIAILKLIEHPHVLKLYDVLETEHRLYLVLEHVKGGELFDYIVSKGRLDREESLRLTAQIVLGLEHCHKHSICHRDLKVTLADTLSPCACYEFIFTVLILSAACVVLSVVQPENLLLDEQLNIKIADFGMAQLMKNNSILKTSCGSPHYASPEIIEGHTYDAKVTDVWSIGVILYALITGSLPFDHDNIPTLLSMVTKGVYQTPAHVPSDVAHLISRMLTVDPSKRIKLCEIRKHAAFKGTAHFKQVKGTSWPYNVRRDKQRKQRRLRRIDSPHSTESASSSSELEASDDSDSDQYVDDSVLTDLEALGLDFNGNREELRAKIKQRSSSSQQPNIERVFYRLLKKRRNSRLEQLSLLSPKISPRSYGGVSGAGYFHRAVSEPEGSYAPLMDGEMAASPMMGSSEPTSRASSAVTVNVSGMVEGEWVRNMHSSSSTATTEGNTSATSQVSTGSTRQPISPLALDDANEYDRPADSSDPFAHYELPDSMRLHTAPHSELPTAGNVQRETSASAYYNRMVARTSPPSALTSMSVPPSPCYVSNAAVVASAPSSPLFSSASPHNMSPGSASAPQHTSALKVDAEYLPPESFVSTSTRRVPIERRSSTPNTGTVYSSGPTSPAHSRARQPTETPPSNVSRRLFVPEEKHSQADDDTAESLRLTTAKSERVAGRSPHARTRSVSDQRSKATDSSSPDFISTPRFHRVRFNGDKQSGLLSSPTHSATTSPPQSGLGSPVTKRSWFSSIFSRRPSLDLFGRASRPKKPSTTQPPTAAVHKPITGVYSNKETLSIADEVRKALKAAGVRYVVKKGHSNGASVFECEVGDEDDSTVDEVQRGMRLLTRRKSTTAIDVPTVPAAAVKEGRVPAGAAGRRASVGSGLLGPMSRTAPTEMAHIPLVSATQRPSSPNRRRGAVPPPAPRHSTQTRPSRTDDSDEKLGTGSRSANTTPRHGGAVAASGPPPHHTRHASLRSPQLTVPTHPVSPQRAVSVASGSSPDPSGGRRRANSMEEAGDDASPGAAPLSPAVRFIVEITSHHSNDLRCVRFVHVGGDEGAYRQVQNDVQARLHL